MESLLGMSGMSVMSAKMIISESCSISIGKGFSDYISGFTQWWKFWSNYRRFDWEKNRWNLPMDPAFYVSGVKDHSCQASSSSLRYHLNSHNIICFLQGMYHYPKQKKKKRQFAHLFALGRWLQSWNSW